MNVVELTENDSSITKIKQAACDKLGGLLCERAG
ncbi:hypothetical protein SAMN05443246_1156 [Paenibacillus sp. GP183]|nr:hypothetical protein SAMN05443246_1156 [Paenibacillus sp. GP183]